MIVTKVSFQNSEICDRVFEEIDKLIPEKVKCKLLGLKLFVKYLLKEIRKLDDISFLVFNVHQVIIDRRVVIWSENIEI